MAQIAEQDTFANTIEATLNYIMDDGTKLFTETGGPGATDVRTGGKPDPRKVVIHNGRPHAGEFRLDRDGFRFVRHDTKVADFYDEAKFKRVYYPEMEALVKAESGAIAVVVFDHTLRTADDELREAKKIREVVRRVHNDYTEWSGPQRVRDLLPDEADELLQRRFAIIQVWRPIRLPVETTPLGDLRCAQHLARRPRDLGAPLSQPRRPDLRNHLQSASTSWFWFPLMRREEALVFKVYDSLKDGRARWTAHTAFDDPTSPSMRVHARASKFARSRFSDQSPSPHCLSQWGEGRGEGQRLAELRFAFCPASAPHPDPLAVKTGERGRVAYSQRQVAARRVCGRTQGSGKKWRCG